MKLWYLLKTKQCKTCPWKVSTRLEDIPLYDPEAHRGLADTIAPPGEIIPTSGLRIMSCHYSPDNDPYHCIGWLHNQIGIGNNLALRIRMLSCANGHEIEIHGPQHECFEDTFKRE